jgi:putative ABC transport system permease protein
MVNTAGDPKSFIVPVRNMIRELDPKIVVTDVQTLGDYFSFGLYPFRMLGVVMGGCGVMALLLATLGIYGIISYSVAQRTRELGIRMALGALQKDILKMVMSFALTQLLKSLLIDLELYFPVSAIDPLTFASVTILLALVALIACYIPARRATEVEPSVALRYE